MRAPAIDPVTGPGAAPWLSLALLALLASTAARGDELQPFKASYKWLWHGLTVAESSLQLEQKTDTWIYHSRSEPRGIGRVMAERPVQTSVLRVTEAGVQPLSYHADDGTASTKRDADVAFDWSAGRASGVYEDARVDMPLVAGIQDDLSVQIAMMVELLRGRTPEHFSLINGNSVREYRYVRENETTLTTAIGTLTTIVYRAQKAGSPRATRFWCAPSRGYIPLRVEQKRNDDVEWTMQIESLARP